jgi:hypothetical protein
VKSVALTAAQGRSAAGLLNAGDTVTATVEFTRPVSYTANTGALTLKLKVGTQTVEAAYSASPTPRSSVKRPSSLPNASTGIAVATKAVLPAPWRTPALAMTRVPAPQPDGK